MLTAQRSLPLPTSLLLLTVAFRLGGNDY